MSLNHEPRLGDHVYDSDGQLCRVAGLRYEVSHVDLIPVAAKRWDSRRIGDTRNHVPVSKVKEA